MLVETRPWKGQNRTKERVVEWEEISVGKAKRLRSEGGDKQLELVGVKYKELTLESRRNEL